MTSAPDPVPPGPVPSGATPAGDGIIVGTRGAVVDAYIDYLCPYCREFELDAGPALRNLITERHIRLVYHPMSFLDRASTTRYSTRAAAAAACAADSGKFLELTEALFVSQPPEGGPGLSDAELTELGASVGLDGAALGACLASGRYLDWAPYVTEVAEARGVNATPTVLVDGAPVAPTARAIAQAAGVAGGLDGELSGG
jgi:protein-disulfide isomerase